MKIWKSEKGQSMVEFAIAFIFLLFFLMGIFEFSWLMGNKLLATHATREGARYAAVHHGESGYDDQTRSIVNNTLLVKIPSGKLKDIIEIEPDASLSDSVVVKLDGYSINHLTGFIPSSVVSNPFPITASTTMKKE